MLPRLFGAALVAHACGEPARTAAPTVSITGTERLAWDQASPARQVGAYSYVLYVDNVRTPVAADCESTADAAAAQCIAPLPRMGAGTHRLELAAVIGDLEGPRSSALVVAVTGTATSAAGPAESAARRTSADGTRFIVETIASGLDMPSATVVLVDGRVLVAEASGTIRLWEPAGAAALPVWQLAGALRGADVGLIGMTADPRFDETHHVFLAYTRTRQDGDLVNRVVRARLVGRALRDAVLLLEDSAPSSPTRPPRIRFGPDGKLYVAFASGSSALGTDARATYAGKVLRLEDDGTTPADNPGYSPVVWGGDGAPGVFDWHPRTGAVWRVARTRAGRDALEIGFQRTTSAVEFDDSLDASNAAFYTGRALSAFRNDLFIAALDGRHLRRVRLDAEGRTVSGTERLLDGEFGRISDVVSAMDGALYVCTSTARGLREPPIDRLLRITAASTERRSVGGH